jgi:aminopeptidase N
LKLIEGHGPIWLGQRLVATISPGAGRAVTAKGVWVIHMLRMMLRQERVISDEKFLKMVQEFAERYDGRAASTWDFEQIAEKHAERELDWFMDQWVFATGIPSYSADYKVESAENGFTVEGTITQTSVPDGFMMEVPVYADSEYLGKVQVGDSEGQFKFRVRQKPDRLSIDPEATILTAGSP